MRVEEEMQINPKASKSKEIIMTGKQWNRKQTNQGEDQWNQEHVKAGLSTLDGINAGVSFGKGHHCQWRLPGRHVAAKHMGWRLPTCSKQKCKGAFEGLSCPPSLQLPTLDHQRYAVLPESLPKHTWSSSLPLVHFLVPCTGYHLTGACCQVTSNSFHLCTAKTKHGLPFCPHRWLHVILYTTFLEYRTIEW